MNSYGVIQYMQHKTSYVCIFLPKLKKNNTVSGNLVCKMKEVIVLVGVERLTNGNAKLIEIDRA